MLFSFLSFLSVYYVLNVSVEKNIKFTTAEFISNKKNIVKSQVHNLVNYIKYIDNNEQKRILTHMRQNTFFISRIINKKNLSIILKTYEKNRHYTFLVIKNGKVLYRSNNFPETVLNSKELQNSKTVKKIGNFYVYCVNDKNKTVCSAVSSQYIKNLIQKKIRNLLNSMKFIINQGYFSIIKIDNFNGGKKFAHFIAYPKNPEWEGMYINDSKKDAKGYEYRKYYLKLLKEKRGGFFDYWFKKNGILYKKISYVEFYKPYNWAIFGGVYFDQLNSKIAAKKRELKNTLHKIILFYIIISFIFLIIMFFIARYENDILKQMINEYEKKILSKSEKLEKLNNALKNLNKNLHKEVKKKTEELLRSYFTDRLTSLPNREKFINDLNEENKKAIAILNINSFKEVNDYYGTETGDEILKKIASKISAFHAYRLSGDEFAVLGDDCDELYTRMNEFLNEIEKNKIKIGDEFIDINFSIGIGSTLEQADIALKNAKKSKMEKIVIYNNSLKEANDYKDFIFWKKALVYAVENGGVLPYVQPIIDASTGVICKYEVLMRVKYKEKIYPPFFLDYAKKAGVYVDLQKIIIQKSFEIFGKTKIPFSVNISVTELSNNNFKKFLLEQIERYGVENNLTIEILESEVLDDGEIIGFLMYLNSMKGIEIAIDDFGSGNSNISYLVKNIPINIMKIDGSLVKNLLNNKNNKKLIKVLIDMARIFKLKTIAEFVENEEIAAMLKRLGIDCLQGYYYSKPFDINDIKEKQ